MKTELDCLPCLLKQAVFTIRLVTDQRKTERRLLSHAIDILKQIDFDRSPPENAVALYNMIADVSGITDPYAGKKE